MLHIKTICVLTSAIMLAGCSSVLGPVITPQAPELDRSWSELDTDVHKPAAEMDVRWWQGFDDKTLTALVERAYSENLTLRVAALRILEARAVLGVARSEYYPTLASNTAVTRTGLSGNAQLSDKRFTNYRTAIDTAWELDLWGRVGRGVDAANADLNSLDAAYESAALSIAAEVAKVYIQYQTTQQQLKLAKQNIKLQVKTLNIAKALLLDSSRNTLDVEQARAVLADTQALIPELERNSSQTRNALITLLSISPSELGKWLPDNEISIPIYQAKIQAGVPADLLRRRTDVKQAELNAVAASARAGMASAERYPRISLSGSLSLDVADGLTTLLGGGSGDIFKRDSVAFTIGPSVSIPLFNAGKLKNRWLAQDAVFQQAIETYRFSVFRAVQDVENSLTALAQSSARYGYLSESVYAYQRALDAAQVLYEEGDADFQSLIDSQRQLVRQQQNQVVEQGNISLSQLALIRALGGSWSPAPPSRLSSSVKAELSQRNTRWKKYISGDEE